MILITVIIRSTIGPRREPAPQSTRLDRSFFPPTEIIPVAYPKHFAEFEILSRSADIWSVHRRDVIARSLATIVARREYDRGAYLCGDTSKSSSRTNERGALPALAAISHQYFIFVRIRWSQGNPHGVVALSAIAAYPPPPRGPQNFQSKSATKFLTSPTAKGARPRGSQGGRESAGFRISRPGQVRDTRQAFEGRKSRAVGHRAEITKPGRSTRQSIPGNLLSHKDEKDAGMSRRFSGHKGYFVAGWTATMPGFNRVTPRRPRVVRLCGDLDSRSAASRR